MQYFLANFFCFQIALFQQVLIEILIEINLKIKIKNAEKYIISIIVLFLLIIRFGISNLVYLIILSNINIKLLIFNL